MDLGELIITAAGEGIAIYFTPVDPEGTHMPTGIAVGVRCFGDVVHACSLEVGFEEVFARSDGAIVDATVAALERAVSAAIEHDERRHEINGGVTTVSERCGRRVNDAKTKLARLHGIADLHRHLTATWRDAHRPTTHS